ncbi:MAG: glycosyltransferase [Elusimicrobia bacterium]|nr:glycosyltransferase [Elusimicrobiota bacterium]
MSPGPRLSIIVPVSRGPRFIEPLIRSLEGQTAAAGLFELILVTDSAARYASDRFPVRTIRASSRHPCAKRNEGAAAAASAEYLGFIDDDVKLEPDWVSRVLQALDAGRADVVTGPSDIPYSAQRGQLVANAIVCSRFFSLKTAMTDRSRRPVRFFEVALCNVALKREVWERVGGFNEVAYYWVDDAEFFHIAESLGFRLANDPEVRLAHYKRPAWLPLAAHYCRQRWYAGLSTWLFPELYLPQRAVPLSAALLLLLLAFPAQVLPALAAALAACGIFGGLWMSPSCGPGSAFFLGISLAVGMAANFLGFWLGLLAGPFFRLYAAPVRAYKRYRYRDRGRPFLGKEIVQPPLAWLRQIVPYRLWLSRGFPQWLIYFVTARCNARCPMCFYLDEIEAAGRERELDADEVAKIAAALPPITYLSLSGGEPFLREDLVALVQSFIDAADPVYVSIPTNGSFPERVEMAFDRLSLRNPRTNFDVHLSLDGPPAVHDRIRGPQASFAKVMETHRRTLALAGRRDNVSVKFVVTCSRENADRLEPFLESLVRLGCDRINLVPLHGNIRDQGSAVPHGRYLELAGKTHALLDRKGYRGIRYRLFSAIKRAMDSELTAISEKGDLGSACGAGRKIAVIGPCGEVQPCETLRESVGNLRDHGYDARKILRGSAMKDFADRHLGAGKCHCNWGCAIGNALVQDPRFYPAVARELLNGSLFGPPA